MEETIKQISEIPVPAIEDVTEDHNKSHRDIVSALASLATTTRDKLAEYEQKLADVKTVLASLAVLPQAVAEDKIKVNKDIESLSASIRNVNAKYEYKAKEYIAKKYTSTVTGTFTNIDSFIGNIDAVVRVQGISITHTLNVQTFFFDVEYMEGKHNVNLKVVKKDDTKPCVLALSFTVVTNA